MGKHVNRRKVDGEDTGHKVCKDCKIEKSVEDFYRHSKAQGWMARCKPCHIKWTAERGREARAQNPRQARQRDAKYESNPERKAYRRRYEIKRKYGITEDEYLGMIAEQGGKCALCENEMERPCLDHDHNTGKVRAFLCDDCNTGLGRFKDDSNLLMAAAAYLITHEDIFVSPH